ncbi:hypothetical protein LCGC14_0651930 [marine sediment metagenome]|uniref:Uncharacterized protein n=1 Tax=marine sediment metagenome TaxID=412755 RepID=A0A0F9QVX0_9ZZZZ
MGNGLKQTQKIDLSTDRQIKKIISLVPNIKRQAKRFTKI